MAYSRIRGLQDLASVREKALEAHKKFRSRVLICMTGCRAMGAVELCRGVPGEAGRGPARPGSGRRRGRLPGPVRARAAGPRRAAGLSLRRRAAGGRGRDHRAHAAPGQAGRAALRRLERAASRRPWATSPSARTSGAKCSANCGRVDPRRIEDAIARGAYAAAAKVLTGRKPRGGHRRGHRVGPARARRRRFPHRHQVEPLPANPPATEKYLICNADEGDPGAFMDRALLEGDPHAVLEGMIIGAYAIGASHGFVYVRAEYPIAVEHVGIALGAGAGLRPPGREHPRQRLLASTSRCAWAPARSSAAKRAR